jgi:UrcA family protein
VKTIALLAAAAAASIALAAPAAAPDDVTAEVDVSDLDPSNPADSAQIDRRIATAARRVCGAPEARTVTAIARVESCRAGAAARARGR